MSVSVFALAIDPVLLRIGPLEVRWYGLMYVCAAICAGFILRSELKRNPGHLSEALWPEMLFYGMVGAVIGGRLGHVVIYELAYFVHHPGEMVWGSWRGMSFHGGLIGVVTAGVLFARTRRVPLLELLDKAALATPLGIMLVKIANLINGELYGRATSVPWGVVFPMGGDVPRHPSQLYEAFFEGPVLFALLWWFRLRTKRTGELFALFLIGYGFFRFFIEFFREPDQPVGLLFGWVTVGQMLCTAMIVAGVWLMRFGSDASKAVSGEEPGSSV
jgi:phosphatidylglycerol---prolipoprotein diacylglyceryl transferase